MSNPPISFGVQASPTSKDSWLELARRVEDLGFESLSVADHPGTCPSPFPALAAAAAVTDRIKLGPYVANAGLRGALQLAVDVATLDVLSDGRAILGLGAGHTYQEWTSQGLSRPSSADRVSRLIETAEAVRSLLSGESTTIEGEQLRLDDARLETPLPVQQPIPLLIGGGNSRLLSFAGAHADVIGLTGLGRTLPDGHAHTARWSGPDLQHMIGIVRDSSRGRTERPRLEALVQRVEITDHPNAAATPLADELQLSIEDTLATPFVLIGTRESMVERILSHRERWGITSFIVRQSAIDDVAPLINRLADR